MERIVQLRSCRSITWNQLQQPRLATTAVAPPNRVVRLLLLEAKTKEWPTVTANSKPWSCVQDAGFFAMTTVWGPTRFAELVLSLELSYILLFFSICSSFPFFTHHLSLFEIRKDHHQ